MLNTDVAKTYVDTHEIARDSHIVPTDYVTESPVTSDPSHSDDHVEAATSSVPSDEFSKKEATPLQDQLAPNNEATLEDFQSAMHELRESMKRAFEEQVKALRSEVTEICVLTSKTDPNTCSSLPSASDRSLHNPEKSAKKTHPSPPASCAIQPALPSQSAVRQHNEDAASDAASADKASKK